MDVVAAAERRGATHASAAVALINEVEHVAIVNHSVRVYLYATALADLHEMVGGVDFDGGELAYACLLHDLGTAERHDGAQRFEVDGADGAVAWLSALGYQGSQLERVWEAIALHTTPQIAERSGPIARLTRLGVVTDFGRDLVPAAVRQEAERIYPRLDIERVLSGRVVEQALRKPSKAPGASWAADLVRAHRASPSDPDGRLAAF